APGRDAHHGIVVVAEVPPRRRQVTEVVQVQGVLGLGPVDGDGDDVVVTLLVVDGHRAQESVEPDTVVSRSRPSFWRRAGVLRNTGLPPERSRVGGATDDHLGLAHPEAYG